MISIPAKTIKQTIIEILQTDDLSRDFLISESCRQGHKKQSVARTLLTLRDAGLVAIDGDTCRLRVEGMTVPERARDDQEKESLRSELSYTTRLYKEACRANAIEDYLIDTLREGLRAYEPIVPSLMPPPDEKKTEEVVVLHMGDLHSGEVVDRQETGGLFEYNIDIERILLQQLAETVVNLCRVKLSGYYLPKLVVFLLGDMVSTNIHNVLRSSTLTVVDSLLETAGLLGQFFSDLIPQFEIEVVCIPGNHGRTTDKPEYKRRYANWDFVLYHFLDIIFRFQSNITFHVPRSFLTVKDISGWKWLAFHGDGIRQWHGIPYYGIIRSLRNIRELMQVVRKRESFRDYRHLLGEMEEEHIDTFQEGTAMLVDELGNESYDYVTMGHFHTTASLDLVGGGEVLMNGSAKGPDEYSMGKMFLGTRPRFWLHGVHHRQGATWRYPINLDYIPEDMILRYQLVAERKLSTCLAATGV